YVADPDVGSLGAGEAGRHDVRTHQYLFVGKTVRHRRQVGLGVWHQYIVGLGAVDAVAEAPATHGFVTVAATAAVLGGKAVLAGVGGEVRADRAGDHPLAFLVAAHVAPELFDDAYRLVADGQ